MNKRLGLLMVAAVWSVAMFTLSAAVQPPAPTQPLGYLRCGPEGAEAWVRAEAVMTADGPGIVRHELVHVAQAQRFASCEAMEQASRDAEVRFLLEAEAYCVQSHVDVLAGRDTVVLEAMERHAATLAGPEYRWPGEVSVEKATAIIALSCQPARPR